MELIESHETLHTCGPVLNSSCQWRQVGRSGWGFVRREEPPAGLSSRNVSALRSRHGWKAGLGLIGLVRCVGRGRAVVRRVRLVAKAPHPVHNGVYGRGGLGHLSCQGKLTQEIEHTTRRPPGMDEL